MISLQAGGIRIVASAAVPARFAFSDDAIHLSFCPSDGAKHPVHCIDTEE
jgi:hypothetical protein